MGRGDAHPVVHFLVYRVNIKFLSRELQEFGQNLSQTIVTQVVTLPNVSDSTVILFTAIHVTLYCYYNAI